MPRGEVQAMDPKQTLMQGRIIWAVLVAGVVVFAVVVAMVVLGDGEAAALDDGARVTLSYAGLAVAGLVIPVGLFARMQVFKKGWHIHAVTPRAYLVGNLIAWSACEGTAMAGLVFCLVLRSFGLNGLVAALGLAMLLLLWPNGKAMQPMRGQYERKPTEL